jgi:hypothetical protein
VQVFLDGEAALEEEERKEEKAGREFRHFNHRSAAAARKTGCFPHYCSATHCACARGASGLDVVPRVQALTSNYKVTSCKHFVIETHLADVLSM